MTVDVDVTAAWNTSRKPGTPSFFLSSLFLMLKAANDVEAFRLRLRARGVWRHDRVAVGPDHHAARRDLRLRAARTGGHPQSVCRAGRSRDRAALARKKLDPAEKITDDIVFHSVLPWLRFTSFTNALPGKGDSIPRIVFGRCARERGRMKMPVAVEVHHALVDGLDVARFFERFAANLDRA